ncbi:MAG: HlyD family efflux transporter periplasmic adaptor subunit [Clostridiales Family XIII bacterium]|jgi:multidrug efflux pump subunit AcrA (membrane-fusion protein)|nr:HlyD family efflux transporter periplasmic adaptor subunit [Clostridiales Family XIII bacterium]
MKKQKQKRKKWPFILIIAILLIAVAVLVVPRFLTRGSEVSLVASAEATTGDISTTVMGSGNLASDIKAAELPYGVTVSEIFVESGDKVQKGDVLATVTASSVASRIADVNSSLKDIEDDLDDLSTNNTETVSVKSKNAARIKKIYAAEGSTAVDVVAENGALMLLSLDGRMAVTFKSEAALATGNAVTVVSSDGAEREGNVLSAISGTYVVTLSDDGTALGDQVTINTGDGAVGSGTLYIHEPLRITADRGQVAGINVAENEYVYTGKTLLTISKPTAGRAYTSLVAKRDEFLDTLEKLTVLAATGEICAPASGTVGEVSVTEGSALSKEKTDEAGTGTTTTTASPQTNASASSAATGAPATNNPSQPDTGTGGTDGAKDGAPDDASEGTGDDTGDDDDSKADADDTDDDADSDSDDVIEPGPDENSSINAELAIFNPSSISISFTAAVDGTEDETDELSEETVTTYDNTGTAFTVIASDTFALSVSVDELDISAVKTGQEASVEMDALEGETFTGKVIKVADAPDESSGSSNYSAIIEIAKEPGMKSGMSATATILNEKRTDVLTIPLVAVQEFGDEIFVYTTVDDDNNFGGRTIIETGLSDGTTVEITSGLNTGDIVYYQQSIDDESLDTMMFGMGGGGMMGGGSGGGGMPEGGGSGGPPSGEQGGFGGGQQDD